MFDIPITVYESDGLHMAMELKPEVWEASQRLVTKEELARLQELKANYEELQDRLRNIRARPEYDPFEKEENQTK